jgi:hypothetical protein
MAARSGLCRLPSSIPSRLPRKYPTGKLRWETRMTAFRIELLHHADDAREPLLAERYDIHAPDLEATVVQARALFGALSPGRPSLVSFRIMEDGLFA